MLFRLKCLPVLEITLDETNRFECLIIGLRPLIATERIMTLVVFQALQLRRCENRTFKASPIFEQKKTLRCRDAARRASRGCPGRRFILTSILLWKTERLPQKANVRPGELFSSLGSVLQGRFGTNFIACRRAVSWTWGQYACCAAGLRACL